MVSFQRALLSGSSEGQYRLTWSTQQADRCEASAEPSLSGWSGAVDTAGAVDVGPVVVSTTARLSCEGAGGSTVRTVTLAPPKEVALQFEISEPAVDSGAPVELTWSADNADRCEAQGDWSGARPVSGSEVVSNITGDRTFTLSCSGPSGSAMDIRTVVVKAARLSWSLPGASDDAVAGYNIYMGTASRSYDQTWEIRDPDTTEFTVDPLGRGRTYYFAVTAITESGAESAYSNEGRKTIP